MYAMNMGSLVCVIVIGIAAGWTTNSVNPAVRWMIWVEKLTVRLISRLRGAVSRLSFSETTPSHVAVQSRRFWDSERTVSARGRPLSKTVRLLRSYGCASLIA
jgi:hypothetical protein